MHRAGGVFAEANYFGFAMAIICVIAIECISQKKFIYLSLSTIALSGLCIIFSDSRSALLSLAIALVLRFGNLKRKRNLLMALAIIVGIVLVYHFLPSFNKYIDNRILSIFANYLAGNELNSISSGRINIWQRSINGFLKNNILEMMFGTGYKSENVNIMADNSYISTLVTMGIFGMGAFITLWIYLLKRSIKFSANDKGENGYVFHSLVVMFLVDMLFLDSMTFTRLIYFLVVIYTIYDCRYSL